MGVGAETESPGCRLGLGFGLGSLGLGLRTGFTGAAGEEVLEGVLVDQPHAAALSSNAVLYLLLLCLRGQWLQLHLQRGHGQCLVLLQEKEELPWVLAHAPAAPYIPPVCASEPATLLLGYVIAARGGARGQKAPTAR